MRRSELKKYAHNHWMGQDDYIREIHRNPQYYYLQDEYKCKLVDVDLVAFVGGSIETAIDIKLPPRSIPFGDSIIRSFTVGNYDYYKTHTGYFYKKHQSKDIKPLDEKVFWSLIPEREVFKFCARLGSPQAGLTRGSKRSFSDRAETQKNKLLEIQNKYKDGVK